MTFEQAYKQSKETNSDKPLNDYHDKYSNHCTSCGNVGERPCERCGGGR